MVQTPRGKTVHSRKFPPSCRVASISAWSAPKHRPYIVCNTSNLLPVPPLDGLHLDSSEVAVVLAAYLPAFQALHHGMREHKHLAHEPTTLEGQRVLILAHSLSNTTTPLKRTLVDAQVQAAVRMALWAGARDVHVTVPMIGSNTRKIFGNDDYAVRLLDTPPDDWVPMLINKMDVILDYTNGFSLLGGDSTMGIVQSVRARKGRYVGVLGEDSCSLALNCRDDERLRAGKISSWKSGLSMFQGDTDCGNPVSAFLPEGRNLRHVLEWMTMCMKIKRSSLFDFYASWKQDRQLAEFDFHFLLELLARRQIRPHIANIVDVADFPTGESISHMKQKEPSLSMTGAIVCEPWNQFQVNDNLSLCSDLMK